MVHKGKAQQEDVAERKWADCRKGIVRKGEAIWIWEKSRGQIRKGGGGKNASRDGNKKRGKKDDEVRNIWGGESGISRRLPGMVGEEGTHHHLAKHREERKVKACVEKRDAKRTSDVGGGVKKQTVL